MARCCIPLAIRVTRRLNQHLIHDARASVRSAENPQAPEDASYFQPQRQRSPHPRLSVPPSAAA